MVYDAELKTKTSSPPAINPPPPVETQGIERLLAEEREDIFHQAQQAYDVHDYEKAVELLETQPVDNNDPQFQQLLKNAKFSLEEIQRLSQELDLAWKQKNAKRMGQVATELLSIQPSHPAANEAVRWAVEANRDRPRSRGPQTPSGKRLKDEPILRKYLVLVVLVFVVVVLVTSAFVYHQLAASKGLPEAIGSTVPPPTKETQREDTKSDGAEQTSQQTDVKPKENATDAAPSVVHYQFLQESDLNAFSIQGPHQIRSGGGLEFFKHAQGSPNSSAVTKTRFSYPITVECQVYCMEDGVHDIWPGFACVKLNWGTWYNARTALFLGDEQIWLPHDKIVPNHPYQVVLTIDAKRTLSIQIDGKTIVQKGLGENLTLAGPVILGAGLGHVIYKSVTIKCSPADEKSIDPLKHQPLEERLRGTNLNSDTRLTVDRVKEARTWKWKGSSTNFVRAEGREVTLGMGDNQSGFGIAEAGLDLRQVKRIDVEITVSQLIKPLDENTFAGFYIDYAKTDGSWKRVALSIEDSGKRRWATNPSWGKRGTPDESFGIGRQDKYSLDLQKWAPPEWDGDAWFTVSLQNWGPNTQLHAEYEVPVFQTGDQETSIPTIATDKLDEAEKQDVAAADFWLSLVDDGKYAASWDAAAEYLKNAVSKDDFVKSLTAARKPLGMLKSRDVKSKDYRTGLPGAADGQYVMIQFKTTFKNKPSAIETVTLMLGKDGKWRVSGYYIK